MTELFDGTVHGRYDRRSVGAGVALQPWKAWGFGGQLGWIGLGE